MGAGRKFRLQKLSKYLDLIRGQVFRETVAAEDVWVREPAEPCFTAPPDGEGWTRHEAGELWGLRSRWAYLKATVAAPAHWEGGPVELVLDHDAGLDDLGDRLKGPEGLVFVDGRRVGAVDTAHRGIRHPFEPGRAHDVRVVLYAGSQTPRGRRLGDFGLRWVDGPTEGLYHDLRVALETIAQISEASPVRERLTGAVEAAALALDLRGLDAGGAFGAAGDRGGAGEAFYASVPAARRAFEACLGDGWEGSGDAPTVVCVGHAHIDLAWLWTMGQTRHKLVRTFTNQDRLLREHGGWVFNQSSPQAYAWVEEDAPDLFEAIVGLIRAGRWEADGATWVEPDTLLPGGESLVRQLLYGKRYFAERLGVESRMFWAPDAFGFSPALPQLLRQAGVDGMVTSKLSWNRYNRFPHDTFRWRGMDGTETVCHFITAPNVIYGRFGLEPYMTTYVGLMKVEEIKQTWERYRQKHAGTEPLMTFGFGDGGGGPTEEMLQTAARLSARSTSEGIPRIRFEKAGELLQRLVKRAPDLPVWDGELDLELHRGTYTTQGWLKRANRKNEVLLHQLEWLSAIASRYGHEPDKPLLDETWKDLLLCQFHDILPGTSISEVYEEEVRPLQRSIAGRAGALLDRACETLCRGIDTRGFESPLVLFNTLSWDRSEPFRLPDGSWRDDVTVPAGGWTVIEGAVGAAEPRRSAAVEPELSVEGGGRRIVSHFWVLELDEEGRIAHLYDRRRDREVVPPGARANEWQVFEDRPMHFDAWDIDAYYEEHRLPGPRCVSAEVVERGPVRVAVELVWEMPDVSAGPPSRISQRIALYASSPRIDFETTVDWHETHQLLKAAFPVDVRATEAAYEVQFGHVRRPTHRNTPWDAARFEGWAHRFVDLSEHGYGVALLNDCKYGHDVRDGVIRLTCLRSPTDPDPTADRGAHEFTYALLPHGGAFQDAGIVRAAAELNVPLVIRAPRAEAGGLPSHSSPVRCEEPAVVIETLKAAEDGDGVVLRCYESHGSHARATLRFSDAPGSVEAVDLLEAPVGNDALLAHEGGEVRLRLRPFQVFSLRLRGW